MITNCKLLNNASLTRLIGVQLRASDYAYEVNNLSFLGNRGQTAEAVQLQSYGGGGTISGSLLVQNSTAQHNQAEIYHSFRGFPLAESKLFMVVLDNFKSLNNTGLGASFDMTFCDRSVIQNCVVQNEALAVISKDLKLSIMNNRILYCAHSFDIGSNTSLCENIVLV
jgi:hypothetical protein